MTHTITPDVPLPAGAVAGTEDWGFWDNKFRTFRGAYRDVHGIAEVRTGGIQLPDGTVESKGANAPGIDVYIFHGDGLSSAQARELAAALIGAADEVDRWAGR